MNIALKACQYIKKFKLSILILEIAILGLKRSILFVIFLDSYLMISTYQIKLDKLLIRT